ncbi:FecR family protein [Shinella sp. CPCC 101442]|uniref:FecR family protein n=1 Tax=Shinella sp. CPCC 101442 TaxID=2932265 RepID=UPI0021522533|nr:FecR family protein [Shinella sp. CPCC 101442]MCR6498143.1 FecR family protein [Shinella sp. CPCC 101442]
MDWLLRLKDEPQCQEAVRGLHAWLEASEDNRAAWQAALRTWQLLGEVKPQYTDLWSVKPAENVVAHPALRRRRWIAGVALAAVAAIAVVLAGPALLLRLQADVMTATGESRLVTLADGTEVNLSGGSAIGVDITAEGRRVRLLAGEAFFDVAHDAARPFTVKAGGAKVVVLGTAFDVALDPSSTTVQLARGVVGLSGAVASSVTGMAPGDMATVDHDTGEILHETVPVGEIGAWRNGLLFVNDVAVESVVARLQRYHPAWISLPDRALARQRVTGLYDLRDPDRALRALVQPLGGKVRTVSDYLRVVSRF